MKFEKNGQDSLSFKSIAGILQDENKVLVRGGGTLQIHVSDSTCAMISRDQILSLTARNRAASKAVDGCLRSSCAFFEWQKNAQESRSRSHSRWTRSRSRSV